MMYRKNRRSHVIWSFECPCLNDELEETIRSEDVDAIRLICDSNDIDTAFGFIDSLRAVERSSSMPIPIVLDALGKGRAQLVELAEPREFAFGDTFTLSAPGGGGDLVAQVRSVAAWKDFLADEANVYFGYGNVVCKTLEVRDNSGLLEVIQGGTVYPDMDIHVPSTRTPLALKNVHPRFLDSVVERAIDFLVIPGTIAPEELVELSAYLSDKGPKSPWLILKVNHIDVYERLPKLLEHVRGVLISRLEMAMTTDPATVPIYTKEMIQLCNDRAKVAFVASEMLGSMRHNATPTRAEVSDIANSVLDGCDAVVLSEELAFGKYACRGLDMARKIIEESESSSYRIAPNWTIVKPKITKELEAVTYAALETAKRLKAKAIVCLTISGNTALHLASCRTEIPVIAVTLSRELLGRLSLIRGVEGMVLDEAPGIDEILPLINDKLTNESWLEVGDTVVFVSVTISSIGREDSNLFTVQTLS